MLSPDQIKARNGKLTASRVAVLMAGDSLADQQKINDLWREMIGDPDYVEESLDHIWAVQLGSATEQLQLDWMERRTGRKVTRRGEVVVNPVVDWAACTLDGWIEDSETVIECKHVGGFEPREKIVARYLPQVHWQMFVTGARQCILSIIEGAREPAHEVIDYDEAYAAELVERATAFMLCVLTMTPPVALPAVAPPVKAETVYDMQGNNAFASNAVAWSVNRAAAKDFAAAEKTLKSLVPADAAKCTGYGIRITRSKAGSLSIREGS